MKESTHAFLNLKTYTELYNLIFVKFGNHLFNCKHSKNMHESIMTKY